MLHAGTEFEVDLRIDDRRGHRHGHRPRRRPARSAPGRAAAPLRPGRRATAAGCGADRQPRHGVGHPPRRRRTARDLVLAAIDAPATAPGARPGRGRRDRTRRAGSAAGAGPPAAAPAARARRTGSRPTSWSRSSSGACGRCSTPRPWSSRSTRATARARAERRPGRPAPGRARRSSLEVALPTTAPLRGRLAVLGPPSEPPPDARGPRRAGRLPRRDGRGVALAARGGPAPPRLAGLPRRDQRAAGAVAVDVELAVAVVPQVVVPRLGALVRRAPARRRGHGCGWPRSPTPTRTSCPSCARRWTPAPGPVRPASCAPACSDCSPAPSGPVRIRRADRRRRRAADRARGTTIGTLSVGRPDGPPARARGRRAGRRHRPPGRAGRAQRAGDRRARARVAGAAAGAAAARAARWCRGSTSRRSTCPRAAAATSAATSTTSHRRRGAAGWSRSATSAARAPRAAARTGLRARRPAGAGARRAGR